jgi:hypothetical protein
VVVEAIREIPLFDRDDLKEKQEQSSSSPSSEVQSLLVEIVEPDKKKAGIFGG